MKLNQSLKQGINYIMVFSLFGVLIWKNTHPNGPFNYIPYVVYPATILMMALRIFDIAEWWKTSPPGTKLKDRNFNSRPVWYFVLTLVVAIGIIIWGITGVNPLAIPNF